MLHFLDIADVAVLIVQSSDNLAPAPMRAPHGLGLSFVNLTARIDI
jgi:hypothetical protein